MAVRKLTTLEAGRLRKAKAEFPVQVRAHSHATTGQRKRGGEGVTRCVARLGRYQNVSQDGWLVSMIFIDNLT